MLPCALFTSVYLLNMDSLGQFFGSILGAAQSSYKAYLDQQNKEAELKLAQQVEQNKAKGVYGAIGNAASSSSIIMIALIALGAIVVFKLIK